MIVEKELKQSLAERFKKKEYSAFVKTFGCQQNEADSNVASAGNYIAAGHGVASNLTALDTQLKATTDKANAAVPRQINGASGKALIFNESDGGGTKFEHRDGTWSFAGVNDGGANGLAGQIYAVDSSTKTGTRINVTKGGIYYTNGKNNMSYEPADEIATKRDLDGAMGGSVGNMGDLNDGTDSNFGDETDTVVEALNDLDNAINTKANANDVYTKDQTYTQAEVDALLAAKMGIPNPNECTPAADGSSYCVLTKSAEGTLYWANVTAPFAIE